jgi:catechol 2,3-dioxygenase-like lactoylglutathione lyase family enzyme
LNSEVGYRGEFRYVFYSLPGRYDDTVAFYCETLGFPKVGGFEHGTYVGCGAGNIEIIDPVLPTEFQRRLLRGASTYSPPRGGFLLIEVEDLEETHRRLVDASATIVVEPTDYPWRFRTLTVLDPSGNLVSLFARLPGWEEHHSP